jgi:hypothetical protein
VFKDYVYVVKVQLLSFLLHISLYFRIELGKLERAQESKGNEHEAAGGTSMLGCFGRQAQLHGD